MFDLNEAIRNWRQRLQAQPDILNGDLDELEDHLREGVSELQSRGLSQEEAFLVSARRLGDPQALAGEFATAVADPSLRRKLRLRWIVTGALAVLMLLFIADVSMGLFTGNMVHFPIGAPVLGWTAGLLRLFVLLIGGLLVWRWLTGDSGAGRIRKLAAGSVVLLGLSLVLILGAASRMGGSLFLSGTDGHILHMTSLPLISPWFRMGLTLLPLLLVLLILWVLIRPRGNAR